jgi:hypothetical protein
MDDREGPSRCMEVFGKGIKGANIRNQRQGTSIIQPYQMTVIASTTDTFAAPLVPFSAVALPETAGETRRSCCTPFSSTSWPG